MVGGEDNATAWEQRAWGKNRRRGDRQEGWQEDEEATPGDKKAQTRKETGKVASYIHQKEP